ncbi:tRNA modification GTPase isoform 1 [Dorcoceras hygrometricum]|uniref:tRNA modification GTPase isoform 1 n=1 Tax=Dorcoceras hygrometricum TaxID=472368 RepID=A0A2Z7D3Z9_9LAMI|nr:tRNA modification GTPase isoform 1 [Dorcoceras hygrometricum]
MSPSSDFEVSLRVPETSSPDSNFVSRVAESIDCSSPPEVTHKEDDIPSTTELHRLGFLKSTRMRHGERMSKAEMKKDLKEKKVDPEGTSLSLSKGKRKASAEGGERRKKLHHEKKIKEPARETVSGGLTSEPSVMEGKNSEQQTTEAPYVLLDTSAISFVAKPSGSVSLDFTRRLIPDQDFDLVKSVPDLEALEAASLHFMQALVWNGEVANRLLRARDEVTMTRRSMDGMLNRHDGLMKNLEEIRAIIDKEKESMMLEIETSRA